MGSFSLNKPHESETQMWNPLPLPRLYWDILSSPENLIKANDIDNDLQ